MNAKRTYKIELAITRNQLERHPRYGADLYAYSNLPAVFRRFADQYEKEQQQQQEEPEPALRIVPPEPEAEENQPGPVPAEAMQAALVPSAEAIEVPEIPADPHACLLVAITAVSQAMGLINMPNNEGLNGEMAERLAEVLNENQRLRAKLDAVGDDLRAHKEMLVTKRSENQALRDNMDKIAKNALDPKAYQNFKQWDRFIRQAPQSARA